MEETLAVSKPPHQDQTDDPYKYRMNFPEMGLCAIINMQKFSKELGFGERIGTSVDEQSVSCVFKEIGFQVQIERDKTCQEIYDIMLKAANDDHSHRSCFVCVVMSHGKEGSFYGFDDIFEEQKLFELFNAANCRSLAGKPKLFFLQKCNGEKRDSGVTLQAADEANVTTIPTEADFLYHYATCSGYVAYRNNNGSWFVQSLCEVLKKYRNNKDLLHILTLVNHKVAFEYNETNQGSKQMPCIVSTLTKFLYLD